LGQASRISGITPATISLLLVFTKRKNKPKKIIAKRPEKAA
jgi:tRNA U34 5-carboxymethylaminomethyl modifying enzyme MnmG/GidA